MNMFSRKKGNLPPQGERTPSGRQEGGTVSAFLSLSSNVGLSTVCTAGRVEETAAARTQTTTIRKKNKVSLNLPFMEIEDPVTGIKTRVRTHFSATSNVSGYTGDASLNTIFASEEKSGYSAEKRNRVDNKKQYRKQEENLSKLEKATVLEKKESRILDPSFPLTSWVQARADKLEVEYIEESRQAPARDFVCSVLKDMAGVLRVYGLSKGLKEQYAKALRKAACRTRANVTILMTRVGPVNSNGNKETAKLAKTLQEAQEEVKQLKEEVNKLKTKLMEIFPGLPVYKKKGCLTSYDI
ncbi:hypothetical protein PUN28_003677 [Cardiocondyla obscurior]|uniref:Uncharacterized protein n=1 Tax=Cardiocondyla obscurior TaxID=286306 RepID=A0AAW2GLS4_9HYME